MAEEGKPDEQEVKVRRSVNKTVLGIGLVMIAVIGAAVFFAFKFVEDERSRDLAAWQVRLGIVADSRTADVNEWAEQQFGVMRELAENASLQLYMTELTLAEGKTADVTDEAAQAGYLRNLLVATAERTGYVPPPSVGEVSANVEKAGVAGLALVDANSNSLVSTPGMPPLSSKVKQAILKALEGEPALIDVFRGATNLPTVGFVLPIFGIQDDGTKGIGAVIGMRPIGKDLFDRLKQPGETEKTSETYLVRKSGGTVEYLSPLKDGTAPLKRSLSADTPELAATYAIEKPGGFAVKRDYLGEPSLVTSRALANLPWSLVRKISQAEALSGTETRLKTILTVFVLIIVGVAIAIIAVWRHGSSVRATQAAEAFRVSSLRFENMSKFMRLVTNSQPTVIAAVDGTTTFTFANEPAGKDAGIEPADMLGKTMASVIGPIKAAKLAEVNKRILANFEIAESDNPTTSVAVTRESHMLHFELEDGEENVLKTDHIPLRGDRDYPPGVLMILDDVTELTRERRRSEAMLHQLINTLVNVVDLRDPFSANHSRRVAQVARSIGEEMGLDDLEIKTLNIAGSLLNLGKIFIPEELLIKPGTLTPEEYTLFANVTQVTVRLLKDVSFEGEVVETINQVIENIDGSGPLKLAGDNILQTARIIAVARAFVGMVSIRSYREALTIDKAIGNLMEESSEKFDRKPVTALINYLENRDGRQEWAHFSDPPKA
jgi:HD-GYP domain-containing protein (c-di-GMP phosphodiesterase class II)